MPLFDPTFHPHRRYNPLTSEYVLVSPHRTKRPWQGQTESKTPSGLPEYDPLCYLCPGNARANGERNAKYEDTFTFQNDYAALLPDTPEPPKQTHPLLKSEPVHGACDVLIFHPHHNLTLAQLPTSSIEHIIGEWIRIYQDRGSQDGIKYVQIFENKGAIMGCSNPHPHGQIWSLSEIPTLPSAELSSLKRYASENVPGPEVPQGPNGNACLLCEYAHHELGVPENEGRMVVKNDHWVGVVPFWATWPFEILLLSHRRHIPSIAHMTAEETLAFAKILSAITRTYDRLFDCSFPYSMGIHQRPTPFMNGSPELEVEAEGDVAHLHLHFTPPLLRSATVRKFLVGFELMAEAQRDLTPEQAAQRLRDCPASEN